MIRFFQVSKAYPGGRTALSDVSLEMVEGELVLLWGPSGAGKSTLIRLILGSEQASSGQLVVGGRNLGRLSRREMSRYRQGVGVIFQDFKLLEKRTAVENVALPLEIRGVSTREARGRSAEILETLGLSGKLNEAVASLSGGERQRVAIARALVGDPPILLADEPTGNLDADWTLLVMELLAERVEKGATVVLATHDPALKVRFPQRVIEIDAGLVEEAQR